MRFSWLCALLLSACASEKLQLAPPVGVDLSGHWQLNEADSDDPQRLLQPAVGGVSNDPVASGGQRRGGGRQGGPGGRGAGGGAGGPGGGQGTGPAPNPGVLGAGLRWPGKELEIKQVAGVVTFASGGRSQIFEPSDGGKRPRRPRGAPPDPDHRDRETPSRGRGDGPPPVSGWDDKTLVIRRGEPDDDHPPFVERYSLADGGQRLVEIVGMEGRASSFSLSRVWDRVADKTPAAGSAAP